jgi:apolipoprotein N-acyltransferase
VLPRPPAPTPRRRGTPVLRRLRLTPVGTRALVAFASGLLGGFGLPPYRLGLLIVVALVPLLWTWRGARPRHAALYGFAWGIGCYAVTVVWIRYFGVAAYVALVVAMAANLALAGAIVGLLGNRGVRSPLLTAAAWTVMEALQGRWPFGGFPWADVGVALHDLSAARALASVGGVLLVTYVAVAAAGFLVDAAVALRSRDVRAGVLAGTGVVALVVAGLVARVTRFDPTPTEELHLAVLQGDDEELSLAEQQVQQLTDDHLELAERLVGDYDLIVFPESSLDTDPQLDEDLRRELVAIAADHDAALLVNARVPVEPDDEDRGELYNSNLLYEPEGTLQGEYRKQHLVPFGEYVPLRSLLGDAGALRQVPSDFVAGDETVVFDVKGTPVGSVVCFESAFGPLVRDFVRDGAEVVVVSTNNRSYRRSGNTEQHLALSRMRAAETGRPVVQASVSGVSAVIEPHGTVRDRTELFEKAIVDTSVVATTGDTLYVRFGDWVVWACGLALIVAAVVAIRRPRLVGEEVVLPEGVAGEPIVTG